jgi:hypothetical protein
MIRIELPKTQNHYQPHEALRGVILWELATAPKTIGLSLRWSTEGKGTTDEEICIEQVWESEHPSGRQEFDWQLPRGPQSWRGKSLSIAWTLTAWTVNPDDSCDLPIVIRQQRRDSIPSTETTKT